MSYLKGVAKVTTRNGYKEALRNLDHPQGANCGDSSMVLAFLKQILPTAEFTAKWVILNCGLHDIKTDWQTEQRQIELNDYIRNLKSVVTLMREYDISLVWISTTPVDDERHQKHCPEIHRHQCDVDAYNLAAEDVMLHAGVPIIDLHRFTETLEGELYCDHVHFNEVIRSWQAAFLVGHIERILLAASTSSMDQENADALRPRILLLGDSTVARLRPDSGTKGWGEPLNELLPDHEVVNLAVSGASTKSFLCSEAYSKAQTCEAVYWLIQFGHNDMKDYDPARFTEAHGAYKDNLLEMAEMAKICGAKPIFVTSPHRLKFDDEGNPTEELLPYVEAVRNLGQEHAIPVIDLFEMTGDLMAGFGETKLQWLTATKHEDYAHFTPNGACVVSALVAKELMLILDRDTEEA
ncbi:SGNH/GDSL hydrolase family protein [Cerasicoccus arenae]|uniref:SGNH/GDSL hydrolase family protein n=1 Tax=Cerasicoccus arenae TaxID=424488 RepID=UPI00190551EA|nr:SGNH/GDSL hydrolase family protein [Cerasicoccus arenae]MBK1859950.1 SGNH/GDSL hydrolase family protein [Cerasicoccus arenae]